jgi:beta-glucanase (GH16 family)
MYQKVKVLVVFILSVLILSACGQETSPVAEPTAILQEPAISQPTTEPIIETPVPEEPAPAEVDEIQLPLVDNFELETLLSGQDAAASIGFITWSDGSAVSIGTLEVNPGDDFALPDQPDINTIVQLNTDISPGGWAGFSHAFASPELDAWTSQDWSPYEGISLWLYGNNTGGALFIDILDNRNPNSTADDAERWTFQIPDDFEGWQYFEIPFTEFQRKEIGNGAPNDGLTLTEVHGYALGAFGSAAMGEQANFLDQVMLYGEAGVRPVEISLDDTSYRAKEGGAATITLKLNKPADETVTVHYRTVEGDAEPEKDFTLPGDTVVFEPGEMKQSFKINTVDDTLIEGNEQTLIVLYDPTAAILNPKSRAVLTIRDSETWDPDLIFDFNQVPPFLTTEGTELSILEIPADSAIALPDQIEDENVFEVKHNPDQETAGFSRVFSEGQDWSDKSAVSFWFYGSNSGETITMELLDNPATTTADQSPEDWDLVWSDEFDDPAGTPPDPGIWRPEIGDGLLNGNPGWGNGEFEYYTDQPENASTDGEGNLTITARAVDPQNSNLMCWYGPCKYTSARLITWGSLEFAFGRVEARLKLPQGQGLWPAFWMLGTDLDAVGWPQSGEIDIMENIGSEPGTAHGTIHGPGYSGGSGIGESYDLSGGNFSDDFHIFAIQWTPDEISWYVDNKTFLTLTPENIPSGAQWVYNHPFFIILNLAVGGNWPGAPDETTTFPQTLMVDYVRVYGAPNTSEHFTYSFVDDFTGWQQIVIPLDAFTRSKDQPDGAPADGLGLGEIWGYNFLLPSNSSGPFYFDKFRLEPKLP